MLKNALITLPFILLLASCTPGDSSNTSNLSTDTASIENLEKLVTEEKNYYKPDPNNTCVVPTSMRELSSGMKKVFYQFTSNNAANLKLFGIANASLGKKEVMVIVDFMQYKDNNCKETKIRYGVGARLFLNIKKAQGGINVTDLAKLAAGVEYGKAAVTYSIEVIGLTGDKIRAALPSAGDFNVEAYAKVISAVDKIQMLASDKEDGVIINPQVIPLSE